MKFNGFGALWWGVDWEIEKGLVDDLEEIAIRFGPKWPEHH